MLPRLLSAALLFGKILAGPVELRSKPASALIARAAGDITSFIALGESYASGVGAGTPDKSVLISRCLRYDQAYPRVLARDDDLPGPHDESRVINNACSGQKIEKILATQFQDTGGPEFPAFGKPQFATISAAGDDIEFKELVLSCIYEFPTKPRRCQDQIDRSNGLLDDPLFVAKVKLLIQTTFEKGSASQKDFRIYYPGYAQFFNEQPTTPDFCSQKTWSLCKFWQRGCEKLPLTVDLRKQLNGLAVKLNDKIKTAIDLFADLKDGNGKPRVKYIDIDQLVQGHRYCEQGKQEPVNNDDDIWFFQWLDDKTTSDDAKHAFYNQVAKTLLVQDIETFQDKQLNGSLPVIGVGDLLEVEIVAIKAHGDLAAASKAEGLITERVKTFHPKIEFHRLIKEELKKLIREDYPAVAVTACDFSKDSCASFESSCLPGTHAACEVDRSTGGGQCQCLAIVPVPP